MCVYIRNHTEVHGAAEKLIFSSKRLQLLSVRICVDYKHHPANTGEDAMSQTAWKADAWHARRKISWSFWRRLHSACQATLLLPADTLCG